MSAPLQPMEPAMLADLLYFFGGLLGFAIFMLAVNAAGRL
jgi:hypothetical protein